MSTTYCFLPVIHIDLPVPFVKALSHVRHVSYSSTTGGTQ